VEVDVECNTLQHTSTHCNTLQHTATQMMMLMLMSVLQCVACVNYTFMISWHSRTYRMYAQYICVCTTHYYTLQHTRKEQIDLYTDKERERHTHTYTHIDHVRVCGLGAHAARCDVYTYVYRIYLCVCVYTRMYVWKCI